MHATLSRGALARIAAAVLFFAALASANYRFNSFRDGIAPNAAALGAPSGGSPPPSTSSLAGYDLWTPAVVAMEDGMRSDVVFVGTVPGSASPQLVLAEHVRMGNSVNFSQVFAWPLPGGGGGGGGGRSWQFPPTVDAASGRVFVVWPSSQSGAASHFVAALSLQNFSVLWQADLEDANPAPSALLAWNMLVVGGGAAVRVFSEAGVATSFHLFHCGSVVRGLALSRNGSVVYATFTDGANGNRSSLAAFVYTTTGIALRWQFGFDAAPTVSDAPAVDPNDNVLVYAGTMLYSVSPAGAVQWSMQPDAGMRSAVGPAVDAGGAYVATASDTLLRVSAAGAVVWRVNVSGTLCYPPTVDAASAVHQLAIRADGSMLDLHVIDPMGAEKYMYSWPTQGGAALAQCAPAPVYPTLLAGGAVVVPLPGTSPALAAGPPFFLLDSTLLNFTASSGVTVAFFDDTASTVHLNGMSPFALPSATSVTCLFAIDFDNARAADLNASAPAVYDAASRSLRCSLPSSSIQSVIDASVDPASRISMTSLSLTAPSPYKNASVSFVAGGFFAVFIASMSPNEGSASNTQLSLQLANAVALGEVAQRITCTFSSLTPDKPLSASTDATIDAETATVSCPFTSANVDADRVCVGIRVQSLGGGVASTSACSESHPASIFRVDHPFFKRHRNAAIIAGVVVSVAVLLACAFVVYRRKAANERQTSGATATSTDDAASSGYRPI